MWETRNALTPNLPKIIESSLNQQLIYQSHNWHKIYSVDLFTKPLPEAQFSKLRDVIRLVKLPSRGSEGWILVLNSYFVMTTSPLRGFFCCIVLILLYTFMVSSLYVRNLYKFMSKIIDYPSTVHLSIWEQLVCAYDGSFALFSYPCERNSYVSFGAIQLSMCEELVCACSIL